MFTTRRATLAGGLALLSSMLVPSSAAPATGGRRHLVLFRGNSRIGEQTVSVTRSGDRIDVTIDININVNIIALPVYRYRLSSRETWQRGALMSLDAECDDNGTAHFARASGSDGVVNVQGSAFTGTVEGNPGTTTYWAPAFLDRPVWISTQDGSPLNISATNAGTIAVPTANGGNIAATRWRIGGDLDGFELYYDSASEWVGSQFEARGEMARFLVADRGADLASLWTGA